MFGVPDFFAPGCRGGVLAGRRPEELSYYDDSALIATLKRLWISTC